MLRDKLRRGAFVITAEVTPPLAASRDAVLARADPLGGLADAVNLTDAASARVSVSSFAAAAILADAGIEPVAQVTCRDRNRIALAGDLLGRRLLREWRTSSSCMATIPRPATCQRPRRCSISIRAA